VSAIQDARDALAVAEAELAAAQARATLAEARCVTLADEVSTITERWLAEKARADGLAADLDAARTLAAQREAALLLTVDALNADLEAARAEIAALKAAQEPPPDDTDPPDDGGVVVEPTPLALPAHLTESAGAPTYGPATLPVDLRVVLAGPTGRTVRYEPGTHVGALIAAGVLQGGDCVEADTGVVIRGLNNLPKHADGYVWVRTVPGPGVREPLAPLTPAHAAAMAVVECSGVDGAATAIGFQAGAGGYVFQNLRVVMGAGYMGDTTKAAVTGLVRIEQGSTLANFPRNVILDGVVLDPQPGALVRTGFYAIAEDFAIVNSAAKNILSGSEAKGVLINCGAQRFVLASVYAEALGIGLLFGGNSGLRPTAHGVVRGFRHHRGDAMRADTDQKNTLEFKEGESIVCEGIDTARMYGGAQFHGGNFKSTEETGKDNPNSSVNDVTVRFMDVHDNPSGVKITATVRALEYPCQPLRRFALEDTAMRRLGMESVWPRSGYGRSLTTSGHLDEMVFRRLTLLGTYCTLEVADGSLTRSVFEDSVLRDNYADVRIRGDVAGLAQARNVVVKDLATLGPRGEHPTAGWRADIYDRLMQHVPDFSAA
jgi:nucleoid-associated protein YgaU